ncbi:hypothetical protein Sinac_4293 [Singulisphaera acidiphila DSM 18658]|uniref:Uncharacterized protein n=1 Tax=Singulisphaera acidiphila (strain ATCC BAA-1392 / DSM 18658 / VKM B-2454 / MOB10) TaxID=886293 RepID=L0DGV0_SINAD|nr:hypothetical protein Sinac_4293 [Singulisphaera acidiphila DSM 18658]
MSSIERAPHEHPRLDGVNFVRKVAWLIPVVMIGLLGGIGFARWRSESKENSKGKVQALTLSQLLGQPEEKPVNEPLKLRLNVPSGLAVQPVSLPWLSKGWKIPQGFAPSVSVFLHMMNIEGTNATVVLGDPEEKVDLLGVISNDVKSQKYLGQLVAIPVRTGVRFPTVPADPRLGTLGDESHRDQCLACLAQLGLPLTYPLQLDGLTYSLQDVLQDSLANFDLHQKELEWTGLAYALYLPPLRQWKNRFGDRYSFDDLTNELLSRSLVHSACGGSHRLILLTILHRADKEHQILSEDVRGRLEEFLRGAVKLAVSTQRPDGTWPIDWIHGLIPDGAPQNWSAKDTLGADILIGGHVIEWFFNMPEALQPPRKTLEAALKAVRSRVCTLDERNFFADFCPNSHALRVVNLAAEKRSESSESSE